MSMNGSNLETVPHFTNDSDHFYDEKIYVPLSKVEIITAVKDAITQHMREQHGLLPNPDPQVTEYMDRYL